MNEKLALYFIMLVMQANIAVSVFYHEPSRVELKSEVTSGSMDFGFTLGYQEDEKEVKRLVVGAPHADRMGRVYNCPITPDLNVVKCTPLNINVTELANDYDREDKDQNFCLGATIATSSKYILTCAPLWSSTITQIGKSGSYGTCFIYSDENNVHRLQGIFEEKKKHDHEGISKMKDEQLIYGGLGWSSLADESNDVVLIGKPFSTGDIQYVNNADLISGSTTSLFLEGNLNSDQNRGYALAAGKFSNDHEQSIFAVSKKDRNDKMTIFFINYDKNEKKMKILDNTVITTDDDIIGNMYGTTLGSADMNADGFVDLLVGAPSESVLGGCETGALYIYKGGQQLSEMEVVKKVESKKSHSRFGTAIATSDLDGDNKPEIFVSAPNEETTFGSGHGVVYILSGHEVMEKSGGEIVKLDSLKHTQRIENKGLEFFGLSLQVIPDINGNGCDELAVGAPLSDTVALFRCVPTITTEIVIMQMGEVKSSDNSASVEICVNVTYHTKSAKISTEFQVISKVTGTGTKPQRNEFSISLANRNESYCEKFSFGLITDEVGDIQISSEINYLNDDSFSKEEFNPNWVRLSKYSEMKKSLIVKRVCAENDCRPNLQIMSLSWNGRENPEHLFVEEKTSGKVTLLIKNQGATARKGCVILKISGGKEEKIQCQDMEYDGDDIKCPFRIIARNASHLLDFIVGINRATKINDSVLIEANLYNECGSSNPPINETLEVKLTFSPKKVFILDGSHNETVTDTQIQTRKILVDKHEYKILNNGGLEWDNVIAFIYVPIKAYIQNYSVSISHDEAKCNKRNSTDTDVGFICTGIRLYANPLVINVKSDIVLGKIMDNLDKNILKVDSRIELRMVNSNDPSTYLKKSQTTVIKFVKETSIANNKSAILIIVIVVALVILIAIAFILYKFGFFKRKERSRLDTAKASVRSKSQSDNVKSSTSGPGDLPSDSKEDSMEDFDIEVIDDCPFETEPLSTEDNAALITGHKDVLSKSERSYRSTSSQVENPGTKQRPSTSSHTTAHKDKDDKDVPSKSKRSYRSTSSQVENPGTIQRPSTSSHATGDTDKQSTAVEHKKEMTSENANANRCSTKM